MFLVYSYCKRNWSFSFNSTDLAHILSTNIHLFVHINPYSIYLLAQSILSTGLLRKCDRTNKIETFQCFYLHFISRLNGAWHLHCTHWILIAMYVIDTILCESRINDTIKIKIQKYQARYAVIDASDGRVTVINVISPKRCWQKRNSQKKLRSSQVSSLFSLCGKTWIWSKELHFFLSGGNHKYAIETALIC